MHLEEVGNIDLKIKSVKDKGNKVIVTFSNDEKLKISKETYLEFNICEDSFLTKSELKEISSYETRVEIVSYIKSLLAKKPYTEREVFKKALAKFENYHLVAEAIKDLKDRKCINDNDYIDNYLDYFDRNNYGKYFIINYFRNTKLDEDLIKKLEFDEENEKRKAFNYFESIKNKFVSSNFAKQKKKIYDRMLQRGFNIEIINSLINNLKIDEENEKERLVKDFKKAKAKYFQTNDKRVDANSKIVNILINKGYMLEDINEIISSDKDFFDDEVEIDD